MSEKKENVKVLIIAGSKSDSPVIEKVVETLKSLGIPYVSAIASAHRTPEKVDQIVSSTNADVIIAIAGMSAALPGVIASKTIKPVIGVPVSASLLGIDALLSIVQMPPGIPVAAVGIDNGKNAAILAAEILSLKYPEIKDALKQYRDKWKV